MKLSTFKLFFVPRLTHFLLWQGKISNSVGGNIWRRRRKDFLVEKKSRLAFSASMAVYYQSFGVYNVLTWIVR